MANTLILPRITGFKLRRLQPIFTADIDFSIKAGPNIVLGGNGLGKTTLVQAVVYGLSGGLDDVIEPDTRVSYSPREIVKPALPLGGARRIDPLG
jgi:ABC-type cobalamin/Fe3+-siderophores transport system ATPase subunit